MHLLLILANPGLVEINVYLLKLLWGKFPGFSQRTETRIPTKGFWERSHFAEQNHLAHETHGHDTINKFITLLVE